MLGIPLQLSTIILRRGIARSCSFEFKQEVSEMCECFSDISRITTTIGTNTLNNIYLRYIKSIKIAYIKYCFEGILLNFKTIFQIARPGNLGLTKQTCDELNKLLQNSTKVNYFLPFYETLVYKMTAISNRIKMQVGFKIRKEM